MVLLSFTKIQTAMVLLSFTKMQTAMVLLSFTKIQTAMVLLSFTKMQTARHLLLFFLSSVFLLLFSLWFPPKTMNESPVNLLFKR